jgi:hypothetical protein
MIQEQDDIIVFRQFNTAIDANIAKSKLDAFGVPCFLTEENMAGLYPGQQSLPIQVRLHIFKKDSDEASAVLLVMNSDSDIPEIVCPTCKGRRIERDFPKSLSEQPFSSLLVLFFGVLMPQRKINHCLDCDNEF